MAYFTFHTNACYEALEAFDSLWKSYIYEIENDIKTKEKIRDTIRSTYEKYNCEYDD